MQLLADYPWVRLFFDGRLDKGLFRDNISRFEAEFIDRGLEQSDVELLKEIADKELCQPADCVGRFPELREKIHESWGIVLPEKEYTVTENDLKNAFELVLQDLNSVDLTDPYFDSTVDILRPNPLNRADPGTYLDLVPLVSRLFWLGEDLVGKYASKIGSSGRIQEILGMWAESIDLDVELGLNLERKMIAIKKENVLQHKKAKKGQEQMIGLSDERASMAGYSLRSLFGIGRCVADVVVPDAPYSIGVYNPDGNLCLLIGFWYRHDALAPGKEKDILVVSQIQQPRGVDIPGSAQGSQIGVVAMEIVKLVASALGFGVIQTYSADRHPMFLQYPSRKSRMKGNFRGYYDTSTKALGFVGSRSTFYTLKI